MTILPGDILIGGRLGYIDHIRPVGTDVTLVDSLPVVDELGNPVVANGIDIDPDGNVYVAKAPPGAVTQVPHDVTYIPDGSGVLYIVQLTPGSAALQKYDLAGALVRTRSIETDDGWSTGQMRVDVALDATTVYYTDSGRTVFRFDISTDDGEQLTPYDELDAASPNIFASFNLLADGGIAAAMSKTGDGPRNAVGLDGDRSSIWTDEINPNVTDAFHIYQRPLANNGPYLVKYPTDGQLDYAVTCAACYLPPSLEYGVCSKVLFAGNAPVPDTWLDDVRDLHVGRVRFDVRYAGETADDFSNGLDLTTWTWIRKPGDDHWSIVTDPSALRITTQATDLNASTAPVLTRTAPQIDFKLIAQLKFDPTEVYQQAGIIVYDDDNNYVRLNFGCFDLGVGFEMGNRVGGGVYSATQTYPTLGGDVVYLKLTKVGQDYAGWWSEDDTNWTMVGEYVGVPIAASTVGVTAFNITGAPEIDAYFRLVQTLPYAADPAASDGDIDSALANILTAVDGYISRGVRPLAVLGGGILSVEGNFYPDAPSETTYIDPFGARAGLLAGKLAAHGVADFEIWNEPNVPFSPDGVTPNPEYMTPEHFASLVAAASVGITSAVPAGIVPTIVTGGILFNDDDDNDFNTEARDYLRNAIGAFSFGTWNQIGIHAYWVEPKAADALDRAQHYIVTPSLPVVPFWLTEFGTFRDCALPDCSDEQSNIDQRAALEAWYSTVLRTRLASSGTGGYIHAAFWFSHEWEAAVHDAGLTDWDRETGDPGPHWLSWEGLQSFARAAAQF